MSYETSKRKGVDGFAMAVLIGIIILVVALIASSLPELRWPGAEPTYPPRVRVPERTVFSEEVGQLGVIGEAYRHAKFGDFVVGWGLGENVLANESRLEISQGLVGGQSRTYSFSGEEATAVLLSFNVSDTNQYGDLMIILNDVVEKRIRLPDSYSIELTDIEIGQNTLTISAESSGLKFWAPTIYILEDFVVSLERYGEQRQTFAFTLSKGEITGWASGRLYFWTKAQETEANAPLLVEINGNTIYNKIPTVNVQETFTKLASGVKIGENTITFSTEKNATYSLKDAELIIFYYGTAELSTWQKSFDASTSALNALAQPNATGELSLKIEDTYFDAGLNVTLNKRTWSWASLTNQTYYANFSTGDIQEEDNNITVQTTGSYKIGRLKLKVIG